MGWLEIFVAFGILGVVYTFLQYRKDRAFRKFALDNGCEDPYTDISFLWGIDRFYQMYMVARSGGDLIDDIVVPRFREAGKRSRIGTGLFGKKTLSTIEPRNVQTVMATKFKDYEIGERRHGSFRPLLGNNIFTSDGPFWEHSRALLRPQFARENINDLGSEEYNVQALFKTLPTDAHGWTDEVDLLQRFYRLTLDGATEFFFNDNVNSQLTAAGMAPTSKATDAVSEEASGSEFTEQFTLAQDWIGYRFRMQGLYWLADGREFRASCKYVKNFVEAAVNRVLSSGKNHKTKSGYSLLDSLSRDCRDVTELRDQCLGMLIAGRDSTAALLGWLFTMFIVHPWVFQKLRTVILQEFDASDPEEITFAQLKSCRYLQYVINETMRLHAIVPMNGRVAIRDTVLPLGGGPDERSPVAVRKGQMVMFSPYVMHRHTEIWGEDALEFKPERWEGRKTDWSFLPFSGGPRICIGQQYALCEASYVVVRMLQQYDRIESVVPNPKIENGLLLTMFPKNGVKVRLHKA
ncbi:MAG: hypothetical protein M1820_007976 [Bogoriella megaspora]|nr:MAG: hypothetical protein M1820_007976 [Bogoriella megaspora]